MSNAITRVSAALTDGDTCLDVNVRPGVKRRVTDLARVTSNALYIEEEPKHSRGRRGRKRAQRNC
ncbi:Invertase/pectin methylesterase inhibitor domain superfamily [Sesbania bispinosa]|nr:Invertase/pectin methylesterase inhibitor domain superfamily [Sesbania bispinosa]